MRTNIWTKITNFKFLGKVLFQKEEICKDIDYEKDFIEIFVTPDYYKAEFEDKPNDKTN